MKTSSMLPFFLLLLSLSTTAATTEAWPGKEWERAKPAEVGLKGELLEEAARYALTGEGSGYIVRHGKLVHSWGDPNQRYDLKSTSKSIGITALGLAIADGKMRLSDKAVAHHPGLANTPEENLRTGWIEQVTLFHLATQTAGFDKPGGYTRLLFAPGTQWSYSDGGPNWLAECVTLVYQRDVAELMFDRVFTPLGITRDDPTWRNNAYREKTINGVARREFGSGVHASVDAMARLGLLYLRGGRWREKQILPADFVAMAGRTPKEIQDLPVFRPETHPRASSHYGMLWWNNNDGTLKSVPKDTYWSWGLGDSLIVVMPSLDIVVARAGTAWDASRGSGYQKLAPFFEPIVKAADASPAAYFPPPESKGGWRKLDNPEEIRRIAKMDPAKLDALRQWLLASDNRNFAAVVIRDGHIVLEVERGNSAKTDSRRVASVSKAMCATVLAIASEQSQTGSTPRKMSFGDLAFDFIPQAQPLSDPRKAKITVRQLLNHTSGICPEATGAPNDGTWDYILGHSGDPRTAKLAFDPGTACGYSTHALTHASLVCETVTGKPYDQFAIASLFKPLGIEYWWFQFYDGPEKYGRHPSHGMGMPARDLARIAYCMLHKGSWNDQQVIPRWFVEQTGQSSHDVRTPEMRWKLNPQIFSLGWERPALLDGAGGRSGEGIPADARAKPGSGGQYMAFVPSLDLVLTRQTGGSGAWVYEEYLRRACAAVLDK